MRSTFFKGICRLLVVSMMCLSFQSARAGMIGTELAAAAGGAHAERAAVLSALNRAEVAQELQSMGLDPRTVRDRVAAMSDEEVRTLAGQVEQLPAGAMSGWGWLAVVAIIAAIAYFAFGWKR